MAGNIVPRTDGGSNLGTADKEFNVIYAKSFGGTIASQVVTTNSPTFTGTPAAPTAAAGTDTTQIATTAFANAAVAAHNSGVTAHEDIRTKITTDIATHNSAAGAHSTTIAAAVNTHNAATDAHSTEFAKYLPLSGGTLGGGVVVIDNGTDTGVVQINGGIGGNNNGASINLIGSNYNPNDAQKGCFELYTGSIDDKVGVLAGSPSGSITWSYLGVNQEVERVVASGDGYIRYASGLQICYGFADSGVEVTFAQAFAVSNPAIICSGETVIDGTSFACSWYGLSLTSVTIKHANAWVASYVAIGRWK